MNTNQSFDVNAILSAILMPAVKQAVETALGDHKMRIDALAGWIGRVERETEMNTEVVGELEKRISEPPAGTLDLGPMNNRIGCLETDMKALFDSVAYFRGYTESLSERSDKLEQEVTRLDETTHDQLHTLRERFEGIDDAIRDETRTTMSHSERIATLERLTSGGVKSDVVYSAGLRVLGEKFAELEKKLVEFNERLVDADRQIDLCREEAESEAKDVLGRIHYGETRLNEAREAIRDLQTKVADLIQAPLRDAAPIPLDLDARIDQRLIEVTSKTNPDTYHAQQRLMEFVQGIVTDNLPLELVTRYDMTSYVEAQIDETLQGERIVDVITDVMDDRGDTSEDKIYRVVRRILRDDVSISIDLC